MRTTKLLTTLAIVLLLAACESPLETVKEKAKQESFTLLLEAVVRSAEASGASNLNVVTLDDVAAAIEEFPGNGLETTQSATGITVTVTTGMYAGCSATLTPNGTRVTLRDTVCVEAQTDAPASEPVN